MGGFSSTTIVLLLFLIFGKKLVDLLTDQMIKMAFKIMSSVVQTPKYELLQFLALLYFGILQMSHVNE